MTTHKEQARAAAKRGDFEEFSRLEREHEAKIRAAVDRGIESRHQPGPLTDLEREAVHTSVDRIVNWDDGVFEDPYSFAETWADRVSSDPVMVKLELAYNLEMDLTEGEAVAGGILGSALDDVIDRLLPYAQKSGGWYRLATRLAAER